MKSLLQILHDQSPWHYKITVVTDHPGFFDHPSVSYIPITPEEITRWTFEGTYHFNVKNRGLHRALQQEPMPFCYLDNDVFPKNKRFLDSLRSILSDSRQIGLFRKEHLISRARNNSSRVFEKELKNITFNLPSGKTYKLNKNSEMWGSAIIASASSAIIDILDDAYFLISNWINLVESHTIEQFALAECAKIHGLRLSELKKTTQHYSTSSRKQHAIKILNQYRDTLYSPEAKNPNISRPIHEILRQKWIKNYQS
jgi:hypothetical protein